MKNFLKKCAPHRSKVNFGWLNQHLHDPCLWNWNRKSISKAFAVGLFSAFLPVPFQMILAASLAVVFSANILLSIAIVWITNPITMGPIFYFNYKLGAIVLDKQIDTGFPPFSFSLGYLAEVFIAYGPSLLLGSFLVATVNSLIGYTAIQWLYRHKLIKRLNRWKKRRAES